MRAALYTLLFSMFTLTCFSQDHKPSSYQDSIIGTWSLLKTTCCGFRASPHTETPAQSGNDKMIILKKDSSFAEFINGELSVVDKYKVTDMYFMGHLDYRFFESKTMGGLLHKKGDTLIIGNCATDGCDEYFVRGLKSFKTNKTKQVRSLKNSKTIRKDNALDKGTND